ncbi:MAG: hypothetical protein QX198_03760 [Methylococcaceae bacterium]
MEKEIFQADEYQLPAIKRQSAIFSGGQVTGPKLSLWETLRENTSRMVNNPVPFDQQPIQS